MAHDRSIEIVDGSGRRVGHLPAEGFTISGGLLRLGPDGVVAAATDDEHRRELKIWDWTRDELLAELPIPGGWEAMSFDADGDRIAVGTGEATIWDVRTGRLLVTLPSSQITPWGITFSPDGSRVAEMDLDGTVRMFDASSGEEVFVVRAQENGGMVMFSSDGSMLATEGGGMVRVWALEIDDLLEIARGSVTRSLTDEECRQYIHVESCSDIPLDSDQSFYLGSRIDALATRLDARIDSDAHLEQPAS